MSEWRELELSSLVELRKDLWKTGDRPITYIGLKHIVENKLRISGAGHSTDISSNKYYFDSSNFLFGKLRPYFRKLYRPDFEGICSTDIWVLRPKDRKDKDFLFYFFSNKKFINYTCSSLSGTGMPRANWSFISKGKWLFPDAGERQAIADVLSSLDDKIDLLHRQNQTLDQLAKTLFRQWFIEEADKSWEEGTLGDVIEIFDNKRIPLSKMQRDKMKDGILYPYYGAASIMDYINKYLFDGEYILLGEDGTVKTEKGYPILQYAVGKFWVNNHAHIFKAKEPYNNFFIWNYLSKININQIITGAVQPKINKRNLKSLSFPKFPIKLIDKFQTVVKPLFDKIISNQKQIRSLEKLRETLLPKLMSGEVKLML